MDEAGDSRERLLDTAERLFSERGYRAVTLREIANALGVRQASLYYHAPGGKKALFVAVTERGLARHRRALAETMATAAPDLRAQLRAAARWLLSQPPVNLARLTRSDLPALTPEEAHRLADVAYRSLLAPLEEPFRAAAARGEIDLPHPTLLAGAFLSIIEGIQDAARYTQIPPAAMADRMVDVLLDGLRPR